MLEVKDATIAVGGRTLAKGLSFVARDGQLTCITGPEASGKTTLLRTLMGFLPVEDGFVSVDGELLTTYSAHAFRTFMLYLPQKIGMLAHQLYEPDPVEPEPETYAVWNSLLPTIVPEQEPEPLSGEEIIELTEKTMAEAADKSIVIADEPTASLTPELTIRMIELLRQQAQAGKTVLIASRKPQVIGYADQVIRLENR